MEDRNSNLRKSINKEKTCSTCELCMSDNKGNRVCAGSIDNYGRIITNKEQKELVCDAWEESCEHFVLRNKSN